MSYRLIALDLDGTTLDAKREIRPATKAVLAEARAAGVAVIVVSGRHHGAIRPYHRELALDTPAICCNGAYVYDFAGGMPLAGVAIERERAKAVLAVCRRWGLHALVYADDDMTYEDTTPHLENLIAWGERYPEDLRPPFRRVQRFEDVIEQAETVWKFLASDPRRDRLDGAAAELRALGGLSLERSWSDRLDIVGGGSTKGARLAEWARQRDIPASAIIAFGDNQNDIDMLRFAGVGVAMAEAEPEVRAAADLVAGSNNSDTIAETLRRLLF